MKKSIIRALSVSALSAASLFAMTGCGTVKGAVYEPGTPVKVGLICLHDKESTYDANFINALDEAVRDLGATKVEYKEAWLKTGVDESQDCYDAAKELVKEGCNVIFADSFGHQDFMLQAAKDWPSVTFCHATGTNAKTANLDNYHNAFASIYEGRFIAGLAAGIRLGIDARVDGVTTANFPDTKVGYVGAFPYAEVKSGYTSWFIGVRSAIEFMFDEAAAEKVTMDVQFTSSWYDPTAEAAAADSLIKAGAKLVSQHADSMGAPGTCEKANIPNVTYNVETKEACPNTYLAYSRINWAPYYKAVVNALFEGKAIEGEVNHNWTGTLATGSVEYNVNWDNLVKNIPGDEAKALAKASFKDLLEGDDGIVAQIKAGTLKVFDTELFALDSAVATKAGATIDANGHVTSYKADTDGDFAGDTEAIGTYTVGTTTRHFFDESHFCSAPYFDLDIKGINLPAAQ